MRFRIEYGRVHDQRVDAVHIVLRIAPQDGTAEQFRRHPAHSQQGAAYFLRIRDTAELALPAHRR